MSWSKSATGTVEQVREAMRSWSAEVDAQNSHASDAMKAAHRSEVSFAVDAITDWLDDSIPSGATVSVNGTVTNSSFGVACSYTVPSA